MKKLEVTEYMHIDIDSIRITLPLPKAKEARIIVKAALCKASWEKLPHPKTRTPYSQHKREYNAAKEKQIKEILDGWSC